jgi:hypothetical protein
MPAEWRPEIETLALQMGFEKTSASNIEERFAAIIKRF